MRRDMELIRKILLEAEQDESDHGLSDFLIPGYTTDQVGYHVYLLKNAGLVEGPIHFASGSVKVEFYGINRLTFAGHEFLDSIRSDSVWAKVKGKLDEFGGTASLVVIQQLAEHVMKAGLGI